VGGVDPDTVLAEAGAALAAAIAAAVEGWVVRCVDGALPPDAPSRPAVLAEAAAAGRAARAAVAPELGALLAADVDAQSGTPLQLVRAAVAFPTDVLRRAGLAPPRRDRFSEEHFPDDLYGLAPASLAALDPALAQPALAWGAAKALAHRRRHRHDPAGRSSEEFR